MPELPEVETMRRGIQVAAGSRIKAVDRPRCRLKPISIRPALPAIRRRAVGRQIAAVERVGKQLVLQLDNHDRLVIHPRMTGLVLLADPPDQEHVRLRLRLSGGRVAQLWFWDRRGLGTVQLLSEKQFNKQLGPDQVGPDALDISARQLRQRLGSSSRPVKVALLDQRQLAGIGNLYASEILHVARIHPSQVCCGLTAEQWQSLARAIRRVLRAAIRDEGSTLSDATYRNALSRAGRYQRHHRVYARAGQPCRRCRRDKVHRIVQQQRSTFFCPTCQPLRRG